MTPQATRDTIEELRELLNDLEHPPDSGCDPVALDSLKEIVLYRIATLEVTEAPEGRSARIE